jgi:HK97 family phage major capsid protein
MNVNELKSQKAELKVLAEKMVNAAIASKKDLAGAELSQYHALVASIKRIEGDLEAHAANASAPLTAQMRPNFGATAPAMNQAGANGDNRNQKPMSEDYTNAFMAFLRSGGKQAVSALSEGFDPLFGGFALPTLTAALYESAGASGGFAVTVPTDPNIIPLAVPDLGVRSVARVIPTENDLKLPSQSTFGTAGIKTESGASTYTFSESNPTLSQLTLSAFMLGLTHTISWELLQDVHLFQEFGVRDLINAVSIAEDGFFVTGTGTGQPQGLVGNTGTGTGAAYLYESTGAYLLNATDDIMGTLKGDYFPNAAWLMSRATAVAIRKAQRQANLFAASWTRENGRDLLHGFPVSYSAAMPAIPTATSAGVVPILFGSFQDGYVIGDRGSSGTFVKILDQPLATSGQTILLGYKRVDGRVRRSEAIQAITISHS